MKRTHLGGLASLLVVTSLIATMPAKAQLTKPLLLPGKLAPLQPITTPTPSRTPASSVFPRTFELLAGERDGVAFAVTQAGPIRINLESSGGPLVLSLRRPDGRNVERQGSGKLLIEDAATPADIAQGLLWQVGVRPAQTATGLISGQNPQIVASGRLDVQAPPADAARVQTVVQSIEAAALQTAMATPGRAGVDIQAQTRAAQLSRDQTVARRQASELAKLRSSLKPEVHAQLDQRIGLRLQGQSLNQAQVMAPMKPVSMAGNLRAANTQALLAGKGLLGTATSASASTGVTPISSGGGATASAATAAPPQLLNLSTGEGDPGTPISLSGADLGEAPGAVHFIVGNGRDIAAPVTYWSAQQIVSEVPYADGLPAYDGYVYVKRADGAKTVLRPFRFMPLYDVAVLGLPINSQGKIDANNQRVNDSRITVPGLFTFSSRSTRQDGHEIGGVGQFYIGSAGYDEYYLTSQLKNGWQVESTQLVHFSGNDVISGPHPADPNHAGAYIVESRPGSDSPYLKVRWWLDNGFQSLSYGAAITVKRPKNLPCAANPCPVL
jgi:hypothetical protein